MSNKENLIHVQGISAWLIVIMLLSAIFGCGWLVGVNMSHRASYVDGYMDGRNHLPINHDYPIAGAMDTHIIKKKKK